MDTDLAQLPRLHSSVADSEEQVAFVHVRRLGRATGHDALDAGRRWDMVGGWWWVVGGEEEEEEEAVVAGGVGSVGPDERERAERSVAAQSSQLTVSVATLG